MDNYPAKYKSETEQYAPGYGKETNPIAKRPKATKYGRMLAGEETETPNVSNRKTGGYSRQGAINRKRMMDEAEE